MQKFREREHRARAGASTPCDNPLRLPIYINSTTCHSAEVLVAVAVVAAALARAEAVVSAAAVVVVRGPILPGKKYQQR